MIAYFPAPYPDELLYSQLARYYVGSGHTAYAFAAEDLYQQKTVRPDMEFLNAFTPDALQAITRDRTMEEVVLNQTMFPYYGRFLPKERRLRAFQALVSMQGNYYDLLPVPDRKGTQRYLRYCPLCSSKDRQDYGETYWHRTHQMIGLNVCPIHNCYLINSHIPVNRKAPPLPKTAEEAIPLSNNVTWSNNEFEHYVAKYIFQVFQANMNLCTDVLIGQFLHSHMTNSNYYFTKGQRKNMELFYKDFMALYKSTTYNSLTELWQFHKIFTNYRIHFEEICALAIFLNISVPELVSMNLQSSYKLIRSIDKNKHGTYRKISYSLSQEQYKKNAERKNWEQVDIATLPLVKQAIADLRGNENSKPRRITVTTIEKLLNLPSKRIACYLPQCLDTIKQQTETSEEFWARKIVWAARQIQTTANPLSWTRIYELANIRLPNFKSCLPYIDSYADDVLAELIKELV